jgi:hypothetical protein
MKDELTPTEHLKMLTNEEAKELMIKVTYEGYIELGYSPKDAADMLNKPMEFFKPKKLGERE